MNVEEIKEVLDDEWYFKYEPDTKFIGLYHPNGGKQSVLEMKNYYHEEYGHAIADFLNNGAKQ